MNARTTVDVRLGERSYAIQVGSGLYAATSSYTRLPRASGAVIVSNDTVGALYAQPLASALRERIPGRHIPVVPGFIGLMHAVHLKKVFADARPAT